MSDRPRHTGGPTTEAIQAIQRRTWIRGIVVGVTVAVLLVLVGWIGGSIANVVARTPAEIAYDDLRDSKDSTARSVERDGVFVGLHWEGDTAVLVARGLPEIDDDREFAVWYVRGDDDFQRITAFRAPEGEATVLLPRLWEKGDVVALSVEPEGGTSSGRPVSKDPIVEIQPEK